MNFRKLSSAALIVSAALALAACGGDDGDDPSLDADAHGDVPHPAGPTGGNTGKVAAPFVRSADSRAVLAGLNNYLSSNLGTATPFVQAADGAVTTISTRRLVDAPTVNDIAGDATFAMGRWGKGRIVTTDGNSADRILDGQDGRSWHYLVYNRLPAATPTTARTCDAGAFTAASISSDGTVAKGARLGATTGHASLNFVPATATSKAALALHVDFTTVAGGVAGTSSYDTSIDDDGSMSVVGRYLGQGDGAGILVGDGGQGAVMIGALYRITLPNKLTYEGVMKFRCA